MSEAPHDPLEDLVDRALRDQPGRSAPRTLSLRVLAEIERRAALPWWRRSYSHWPMPVRAGFVALSAAVIVASLSWTVWPNLARVAAPLLAPAGGILAVLQGAAASVLFTSGLFNHAGKAILGSFSPGLLYAGVLGLGALYALLAGLLALSYRNLYVTR
jgi:hypothetical protein